MKILSEKTGQTYETVEACLAAEEEYDAAVAAEETRKEQLANERKTRAEEVEAKYRAVLAAQDEYRQCLAQFVNDYGSFHMTIKTGENNPFNALERLFDFWRN